jgi:hypothetical protein
MATETVPVAITIGSLTPVHSRGKLRFATHAVLEVGGLEFTLQGILITEEHRGRLSVLLPQTKHPVSGVSYPAIALPVQLHRELETLVLQQLPGNRAVITYPEEVG